MSIDVQNREMSKDASMNLPMSLVSKWLMEEPSLQAQCKGLHELDGQVEWHVDRVHTDTRTLRAGDLFVALKGENFDANDFLEDAKSKGAKAAVCARDLDALSWRGVEVNDPGKALGVIAAAWRRQFDVRVIAVTGSNGKTTVTQMLASILSAWQGERSLATEGNFNNAVGVPMTLLRMRSEHLCAVLELGMNHPGEIAELAHWVEPQVALVNNAQREHQEFMGTVQAVAEENAQVFKALSADGIAVFPIDDPHSALWQQMSQGRRVCRFGRNAQAEVVLLSSQWINGAWQLSVQLQGQVLTFGVHLPGQHNVHNALASIACAHSLGVPLEKIQDGLLRFQAVKGRSHFKSLHWSDVDPVSGQEVKRELGLVDDTYNANPDSVIAAIDLLAQMQGPKVLVLGDMGEVGEQGVEFHQEVGRYARQAGIDHLLALGDLSLHAVNAYEEVKGSGQSAKHFEAVDALIKDLKGSLMLNRSVLVKGSRFMKMERIVQALLNENKESEVTTCS
jgi:UDP-N-acetylmuramoyl-tripeptide--D-alanyl-D-alanine ligase